MANDYDKLKKQLIEYYQDLLIVQYHDKPKAKAMIKAEMEETLANLLDIQVRDAFDVDTAVGVQLDIIGKWVGVDRIFKGQMFDNQAWFSLTRYNKPTTPLQGGFSRFDNFDTLEGGFLTYDFIVSTRNNVNDTDFRMLIKLKIIRNNIKHSPKDIDEAMYKLFADTLYTVWNEMVYNSDAFTVVGSPTITDDGIASGFSKTNYLTVPIPIELVGNPGKWTMTTKFHFDYAPNTNSTQCIFCNEKQNSSTGLLSWVSNSATNKSSIRIRLYNSSNNVIIDTETAYVSNVMNKNTTYFVKAEYDNLHFVYSISEDGKNWTILYDNNISEAPYFESGCNITIGTRARDLSAYILNSIDLKQFSITVDGKKVLSGSKSQPMEMTFYYKKKNYGIVKLGQEKNCFPIPTGVKANFVEVK